jgi:hypothetical protein
MIRSPQHRTFLLPEQYTAVCFSALTALKTANAAFPSSNGSMSDNDP